MSEQSTFPCAPLHLIQQITDLAEIKITIYLAGKTEHTPLLLTFAELAQQIGLTSAAVAERGARRAAKRGHVHFNPCQDSDHLLFGFTLRCGTTCEKAKGGSRG